MVLPINNKKVNLTYQVPMDYPDVFNQSIKNIENEKKNLHTLCSESEVRQNKALKLKNLNRPLWCGSCQAEQDPEYPGKYCDQCQKDPWYGSHKPWEQPIEKIRFGAFEADYAEFEEFKSFMKFKNLSLQQ